MQVAEPQRVVGSPQQQRFWAEITGHDSHVVLEARAGTGKTFSVREAMRRINGRAVYCAFNKHIADEFAKGLPPNATASTMHSLGNRVLRRAFPKSQLDGRKLGKLIEAAKINRAVFTETMDLVGLVKNNALTDLSPGSLLEAAARQGITFGYHTERVLEAIPAIIEQAADVSESFDFDDMIWIPVHHQLDGFESCEALFIDEAQDLSPCQQKLAHLIGGGRHIVVGDPFQAIYGFRGADSESINSLRKGMEATGRETVTMPLTMTRRCPQAVVNLCKGIVPDLEAMPNAPEGDVDSVFEHSLGLARPGDMVLCRTNAPLAKIAAKFAVMGLKAIVRGADQSRGLLSMARKFAGPTPTHTVVNLRVHLDAEVKKLTDAKASEASIGALEDKVQTLIAIVSACSSNSEVERSISGMFSDDIENAVILSSIHRSKGLEARTVFVIEPGQIPHKRARMQWEKDQERNLAYVAATRAKESLYFVGDIPAIYQGGAR